MMTTEILATEIHPQMTQMNADNMNVAMCMSPK